MRVIACGDALYSSRNLAKRLDARIVDDLRAADGVVANAEFCTPRPETPPAPRRTASSSACTPMKARCTGTRVADASGRRIGFYADSRFWKGCYAMCDVTAGGVPVTSLQ